MDTFSSDTRDDPPAGARVLVTRTEREFLRIADALGEWPSLIARLLRDHGEVGVCSGCTMPGGRNTIMAPCPVRYLALLAQTGPEQRLSR